MKEIGKRCHVLKKNDIHFRRFDEVDISDQRYRFYLIFKANIIIMKKVFIRNRPRMGTNK